MERFKRRIEVFIIFTITLLGSVSGYSINTTANGVNSGHISHEPKSDLCSGWSNSWFFGRRCKAWTQPWTVDVIRNDQRLVTVHRSLNHQAAKLSIQFTGSAVWVYGPPRSQLSAILPDYKICLHENHRLASDPVCYRVDVAEAYSTVDDRDEFVVIFAKGNLQHQEHQVVVSVADPTDDVHAYTGIYFSHAVYTSARPTPWPVEEDHWRFRRVVMHDTHPLLSYSPSKTTAECGLWWWCQTGWTPRTYTADDGSIVSWRDLRSENEGDRDKWGITTTFTAGAVAIYGAPKSHVANIYILSSICIQINSGLCELVDLKQVYLNWEHDHDSVLLWRHDALDSSRNSRLTIRLMKTSSGVRVFPFRSIHYFEPQEYSSPNPPAGHMTDVVVPHDNGAIVYHPGRRRCTGQFLGWCTGWVDPWSWREAGPSDSKVTYRSTVSSYRATEDPSITLGFRGSAVYVYGAPRSLVEAPFASQQICINDNCRIIDVEQAYLNAYFDPGVEVDIRGGWPERAEISATDSNGRRLNEQGNATTDDAVMLGLYPELEPVLLWSMTGLDDQVQHRLRLALAELPSVGYAEMSVAKVVYTDVTYDRGQPRLDTPLPPPDSIYQGPAYPPHAKKWELKAPASGPSTRPPQTIPPRSSKKISAPHLLMFLLIPITLIFLCCLCCVLGSGSADERQPILPPVTRRYVGTQPNPVIPRPPVSRIYRDTQPRLEDRTDVGAAPDFNTPSSRRVRCIPPPPVLPPTPPPQNRREIPSITPSHPAYAQLPPYTTPSAEPTQPKSNCSPGPATLPGANTTQASSSSSRITPSETRPENQNNRGPVPGFNLASPTLAPGVLPAEPSSWLSQTQRPAPPPPRYTQPPTYYTASQIDMLSDSSTVVSEASTILPTYRDALSENSARHQRTADFATEQSALLGNRQPASPSRHQLPQFSDLVSPARAPVVTPTTRPAPVAPAQSPNCAPAAGQNTTRVHQPLRRGVTQHSGGEIPPTRVPRADTRPDTRHITPQARSQTPSATIQPVPSTRAATNSASLPQRIPITPVTPLVTQRSQPVQPRDQVSDPNAAGRWTNNQQRTFTPALSQWAANSGYNLNALLNAGPHPPRAPSRTGNRDPTPQFRGAQQHSGQTPNANVQQHPPNRNSHRAVANISSSGDRAVVEDTNGRGGRSERGRRVTPGARGGRGFGGLSSTGRVVEVPNIQFNQEGDAAENNMSEGPGGRGGHRSRGGGRRGRGQGGQGQI